MCVMCSTSVPTLFQYFFYDHIPTFLYIFHEMFFITCNYYNYKQMKGVGTCIYCVEQIVRCEMYQKCLMITLHTHVCVCVYVTALAGAKRTLRAPLRCQRKPLTQGSK